MAAEFETSPEKSQEPRLKPSGLVKKDWASLTKIYQGVVQSVRQEILGTNRPPSEEPQNP